MRITDYISTDLILTGVKPADKRDLCEIIVDHLIAKGKITPDRRDILTKKLMERESLSSTGIGEGVAIPHASGENIEDMIVVVCQVPGGVDYAAIDGEPVELVFMIVGSERVPRSHLQLLATIVRACKNKELIGALKTASTPEEVYGLVTDFDRA